MTIADIYLRTQNPTGTGLQRQERACREWCAENDVTVRNVISENASAWPSFYKQKKLLALYDSYRKAYWEQQNQPLNANECSLRTIAIAPPDFLVFEEVSTFSRAEPARAMRQVLRFSFLGVQLVRAEDGPYFEKEMLSSGALSLLVGSPEMNVSSTREDVGGNVSQNDEVDVKEFARNLAKEMKAEFEALEGNYGGQAILRFPAKNIELILSGRKKITINSQTIKEHDYICMPVKVDPSRPIADIARRLSRNKELFNTTRVADAKRRDAERRAVLSRFRKKFPALQIDYDETRKKASVRYHNRSISFYGVFTPTFPYRLNIENLSGIIDEPLLKLLLKEKT